MELDKFLEKFLPDYQARFYKETHTKAKTIFADEFWRLHFPEALQNFADKICEAKAEMIIIALLRNLTCGDCDIIYSTKNPEINKL